MAPRLFIDEPLGPGQRLTLAEKVARHVQVLRLQPGDELTLFDGRGGEWIGRITRIGRRDVAVEVDGHRSIERELAVRVTLSVGVPANERFDWLVEKATELGAASIEPVVCARSVVRLSGERADRKAAHWRAVAAAAAEQCGRNRLPELPPAIDFARWCDSLVDDATEQRIVLSTASAPGLGEVVARWPRPVRAVRFLSGPEGGLTAEEQARAEALGWQPASLGASVLRAETAPLAALSALAVMLLRP